jgi:RNA polymerase sigma factor (sigma-70 family)
MGNSKEMTDASREVGRRIMASASAGDLGRQLGRLFDAGTAVGLSDGELIRRFANRRDESAEAAFETILARHGAMVLSVCRQVLGDPHAAEDAFQATFLVLVRRAGSLRVREPGSIGPWLYGVAYRIALKARQSAGRRRARERRAARPAVEDASSAIEHSEFQALLHDEVNRLPSKYRAPVVLCYFEGRSHDEAAAALDWPVGTVRGRLSRARDRLRRSLTRRGLAPAGLAGASWIETAARAEVPAPLRDATIAAAVRGEPAAAVAALARFMLRSLLAARLKVAVGTISAMALLAAGVGFAMQAARTGQQPGPGPAAVAAARPQPVADDRPGEPLPRFARARLGDLRFFHGDWVQDVSYTPDGKSLVTRDQRGLVRVWDAATGRTSREIGEPGITFRQIAPSPDGKSVATVESPARLRLWDLASGQERRRWHAAKDESYGMLRFSPDGRTLAMTVTRRDVATRKSETFIDLLDTAAPTEPRRRIRGDWARLRDLRFSPDGRVLATASNDSKTNVAQGKAEIGSTRLWDVATSRELGRFPVEGAGVGLVAFSPDGRRLAAAVADETIRIYDRTTGKERLPRLGAEDRFRPKGVHMDRAGLANGDFMHMIAMAFSPDGAVLASGSHGSGNTGDPWIAGVYLWDVERGRELRRIPAHQGWTLALAYSPDGRTLATTGTEMVVRVWDAATGREAIPQSGHRSEINLIAVSPADGTIFTAGQDGTIREWEIASGRARGVFAAFSSSISAMAFAPDGKALLVGQGLGVVTLWDVATRRKVRQFAPSSNEEGGYVWHLAFAPDGKTVASGWKVWDVATGRVLAAFPDRDPRKDLPAKFSTIFYTPDGQQIITAESQGVRFWDIASGQETRGAVRAGIVLRSVALSHDGRFLASGGEGPRPRMGGGKNDPSIHVRELATGQEVATLVGHEEGTRDLAFSPDGRLLASGSGSNHSTHDATVRIWDLADGRELRRFDGHLAAVNAVAFAPDGRSVVSGSVDGTALVWDVSDLKDERKSEGPLTPETLRVRWDELASVDARAAYRAAWRLSVPSAVTFLDEHLRTPPAAEPIDSPEVLRTLRAIAALERARTPEARAVIARLAGGDPAAVATREARMTLGRLDRPAFSSRPAG